MRKRLIKIISVLLVICIVGVSSAYAFALSLFSTETVEVPILQGGSFYTPVDTKVYYKSGLMLFSENDTLEDIIYDSLFNYAESFNVLSYQVSKEDFIKAYVKVINDHPELFYVSSSIRYSVGSSSGNVFNVYPFYVVEQDELEASRAVFNKGAAKALSLVDNTMNDMQKCLVLHDYLCGIATYPNDLSTNDKQIYHSAYGIFYDGKTVCAGYALAYAYLLKSLGIKCEYVTSEAMKHAWNVVKIDGKWYNVDLTFDDFSLFSNKLNTYGAVGHRCFMKSDAAFADELGYYHYDGITQSYCVMNTTTYDNYFWNNIDTNIPVINGNYYYLTHSSPMYLNKRTVAGQETRVGNAAFSSVSASITSNRTDAEGVTHQVQRVDYFGRLIMLNNRFYINSNKTIYSYCPRTNTYTRYLILNNASNYIGGLGVVDNQLVYQIYNDSTPITLDKQQYFSSFMTVTIDNTYNNYPDINDDGYVNAKDFKLIRSGF